MPDFPDASIQLYLGSASPRRQQLLAQLRLKFYVVVPQIDESGRPREAADQLAARLARAKAQAAQVMIDAQDYPQRPVLGADTVVALDNRVLGKPHDLDDARRMLGHLSASRHEVFTALALADGGQVHETVSRSEVTFRALSPAEIDAYWATGEPCDKAGAYAIQGLGALFVRSLAGSYSGVMGLPLYELDQLLNRVGIKCL